MKTRVLFMCFKIAWITFLGTKLGAQTEINYIQAMKDTLASISSQTSDVFFQLHCKSMQDILSAKTILSSADTSFIKGTYIAFNNEADPANAKKISTYLTRKRPFIISWISPTDGQISFSWLSLPANWDPAKMYPLYVQLHGNWNVASNTIEYMTYPYLHSASSSFAFEDGYLLSPWGRGNLWYLGISETDIWECITELKKIASIDPSRMYLCGHSMGGYGSWHIGHNSPNTWAALGIHAGAIWYNTSEVSTAVANELKNVPVYFVCGTLDQNLEVNQIAYQLLKQAGNMNISFATFTGGHDYRQEDVENMYLWMHNFINTDWNDNPIDKDGTEHLEVFPNPFQSKTLIKYKLSKTSPIKLEIFSNSGSLIQVLIDFVQNEGEHEIEWIPENIAEGLYYVKLKTDEYTLSNKLIYKK